MVESTNAAGTMIQIARGVVSFWQKSAIDVEPVMPSPSSSFTAVAVTSKPTHSCPFFISRRTRFAPIRPRPIMPSCITAPFLLRRQLASPQEISPRPRTASSARCG